MNVKLNPTSNATKAKSLLVAVTIAVGLHGALLWQMNEVANAGAHSAMLAAPAVTTATRPAQAPPASTYRFTLEPVTILAHRDSGIAELRVASVDRQAPSPAVDGATNAMSGRQTPVYLY